MDRLVLVLFYSTVSAEISVSVDTLEESGRSIPQALGRAPVLATEGTVDAVKWMAKRRQFTINGVPYGVTGLPFIFYNPNTGWNSGARIHWADYRRRPYRYKLTLHSQRSTEGKRKHIFRLKVPRISGTGFGIRLRASTERNLQTRYYGLGNNSEFKSEWIDPKSNAFKSKTYYFYELKEDPKLTINFLRHIHGPLTLSMGFGLENTKISSPGPQSFLAEQGAPDGEAADQFGLTPELGRIFVELSNSNTSNSNLTVVQLFEFVSRFSSDFGSWHTLFGDL